MQRLRYLYPAAALGLALTMAQAQATIWTATRIPGLSGASPARATDINNAGQVVGYASVAGGGEHAFLYEPGVRMKDLGTIGSGRSSGATAINDAGQIIGWSETGEVNARGIPIRRSYVYKDGIATELQGMAHASAINNSGLVAGISNGEHATVQNSHTGQILWEDTISGGDRSWATAINSSGQVVGKERFFQGDDGFAFQYDIGSGLPFVTNLDMPTNDFSTPSAINDAGRIVGTIDAINDLTAFVYENGAATRYASPYGLGSRASDINNLGDIVGALEVENDRRGGSVWHAHFFGSDGLVNLNDGLALPEGEYLDDVIAMNDRRDILASSNLGNRWLLSTTPIPEPETWAMLLAGLGFGALARQRSRHVAVAARN